jgi:hypothetical protein
MPCDPCQDPARDTSAHSNPAIRRSGESSKAPAKFKCSSRIEYISCSIGVKALDQASKDKTTDQGTGQSSGTTSDGQQHGLGWKYHNMNIE